MTSHIWLAAPFTGRVQVFFTCDFFNLLLFRPLTKSARSPFADNKPFFDVAHASFDGPLDND